MNVHHLPTERNLELAWTSYHALVMAADADRRLWADLDHCKAVARAWDHWRALFLASEKAA
ncbi:MAG: hypothetical protein J7500_15690 [Sphingomonas sp.]|uniref:hypothetical protein n=1 Tax=Sphingomonas sp. TaxID=28214 RepID=UPI001B2EC1DD|nr:hypothetical protein [Sphingomonas sp.]MBO9624150.1 hypothetical protein [Sphingomonas sp.]